MTIQSFSQFMHEALYAEDGYYFKTKEKIGSKGDFITSSNFGMIFAEVFSSYFLKKVNEKEFSPNIVEIGAGTGKFSKVVYNFLKEKLVTFQYILIEESPYHRELLNEQLGKEKDVLIFNNIESAKEHLSRLDSGIVFMNELLDAIPTEIVKKVDGEFLQLFVNVGEKGYIEEFRPLEKEVQTYINRYDFSKCNNDHRIEVSTKSSEFLQELFTILPKMLVVNVDYGYVTEEMCRDYLRNGSIRGYYKHQLIENVYDHFKEMDITYHIHWDEFFYQAERAGFKKLAFSSQQEFLMENGILNLLNETIETDPFHPSHKRNRQIKGLLMGSGISQSLQVGIVERK